MFTQWGCVKKGEEGGGHLMYAYILEYSIPYIPDWLC